MAHLKFRRDPIDVRMHLSHNLICEHYAPMEFVQQPVAQIAYPDRRLTGGDRSAHYSPQRERKKLNKPLC